MGERVREVGFSSEAPARDLFGRRGLRGTAKGGRLQPPAAAGRELRSVFGACAGSPAVDQSRILESTLVRLDLDEAVEERTAIGVGGGPAAVAGGERGQQGHSGENPGAVHRLNTRLKRLEARTGRPERSSATLQTERGARARQSMAA